MRISSIMFLASAAAGLASAASASERNFPVGSFDRIAVAGAADVAVMTGKAVGVHASGNDEALDRLDIQVEDGVLRIGTKRGWGGWGGWRNDKTRITVSVPMLRGADVTGSANVSIDRIDTPDFAASVAGSGDLRLANIAAAKSRFSVAGSGSVDAAGRSDQVKASVAGSGDLKIAGLKTVALVASVSGSGNVDAFATGTASVSVAGSGDVRVRGGARCSVSKAGSGSVDCR